MKDKLRKEWFLETKWGKVAMISRGDRHLPGVLLVHGYMDSAATFEPLLSRLPDTHHYVSFDYPGHGKSDHIATSQLVPQVFIVEIIKEIINYLQWERFVCIAHSIGCLISLLFNHLYPDRIKKLVSIDPVYPLSNYYGMNDNHGYWYKWVFEYYYDHYYLYNGAPPRLYTRDKLIEATMKTRNLNREQAEVALSRSLVPVENGMYSSSIQPLMRRMVHLPLFKDAFRYILTHNTVPTLNLHSLRAKLSNEERSFAKELFPYETFTGYDLEIDYFADGVSPNHSSIQPLMRRMVHLPLFKDAFRYILTHNTVPTLNLHSLRAKLSNEERSFAKELFPYDNPKQVDVFVDAGHDLHVTHPDELVPQIVEFLNKDFKAKL